MGMIHSRLMKKAYVYSIVGLMTVLIALMSFTSTPVTYKSQAYLQQKKLQVSSSSSEPMRADVSGTTCVSSLQYVPQALQATSSCFVQFRCVDQAPSQLPQGCSQENSLVTCQQDSCLSVRDWTERAKVMCGCSQE